MTHEAGPAHDQGANQELDEKILVEELAKMNEKINLLESRTEKLERMISKLPEFADYWERLNGCGYMD